MNEVRRHSNVPLPEATHSMDQAVAYLSSDVLALTGATDSYLSFLVRCGLVRPLKHRNGRTNLFTSTDVERVRWAVEHRGRLSIDEMRVALAAGGPV
jgi:DNA-binding transcriptional MerR regulator